MNFQKSNEFRFLREISIVNVVRETGSSVQKTLQLRVCDLPNLTSTQAIQHMQEYVSCRRSLFSNVDLLFPTESGSMFLSMKFKQNLRKLLTLAGQPISPSHPAKMTEHQIQAILNLKFQYQRSKFQQILAASFLGFQGLRPSEVANLKKEDIDFDQKILIYARQKARKFNIRLFIRI